jgi:hypothetical protein
MQLTRRSLLASGAALAFVPSAAAETIDDNDLAWLRLLLGAELLGADFYASALAAKQLAPKQLRDALAAERAHYANVARLLSSAGVTPATADDLEFSYPAGTFGSPGAVAKLAVALEQTFLGAYLGAVAAVDSPALKATLAPIAAAQAQHLAVFEQLRGGHPLRPAVHGGLSIDRASNLLDAYTA